MATRKVTERGKTTHKAPPAGSAAPPIKGGYYAVRPGLADGGPEYFPRTLAGMTAAMQRAGFQAFAPLTEITMTEEGDGTRVLFRYENGVCTLRPDTLIPRQETGS